MARASEFTAVPGWGGVLMGVSAIVTAAISGPPDNSIRWVTIWFADAAIAAAIALIAINRKAVRTGVPLWSAAPARRFAIACERSFDGRVPRTEFRLTAAGRRALEKYLVHMEAIIKAVRD